jgi:hypothetical protein
VRADYQTWDEAQLKAWLQSHNIQPPETYTSTQLQVWCLRDAIYAQTTESDALRIW